MKVHRSSALLALLLLVISLLVSALGRPGAQRLADADPEKEDKVPGNLNPQLNHAFMEVDKQTVKVQRVIAPWRAEHRVGTLRLVVKGEMVEVADGKSGKRIWTARASDGRHLHWLQSGENIAYLQSARPESDRNLPRYESPATVRCLDLKSGKWLSPLTVGTTDKPKAKHAEVVVAVVVDGPAVVVLSMVLLDDEKAHEDGQVSSYRVSAFQGGKPLWSKSYPSAGERDRPGAFLWAARRPDYAVSSIRHLGWLRKQVLVCGGEKQDLICLSRASGEELRRVPRIWEFARGFTGPSVWAHHINRFGLDKFWESVARNPEGIVNFEGQTGKAAQEAAQKKGKEMLEAAAKNLKANFECLLVGGPIVITSAKVRGRDDAPHSIFVAVSKGPKSSWAGYLSDCVVYELNEEGNLVGVTSIPRLVNGWQWGQVGDGLVWACQQGGMVRLGMSENRSNFGGHLGRHDMLCRVMWYRQLFAKQPEAWLTAGLASEATAFTATHAFRVVAGGHVRKQEETAYRFPISVVELATGLDRTVTLVVPLQNKVPEPKTNFSKSGNHISTLGPYLLGITGLQVEGETLRVTLGMENQAIGADFPIDRVINPQK